MLETIASAIRETGMRTRRTVRVGPFAAFLDGEDAAPWQSLAYPMAGDAEAAEKAMEAVAGLRRLFSESGRTLRFELFDDQYPRLVAELNRAGLASGGRHPLMACQPREFRGRGIDGLEGRLIGPDDPDETLGAFLRVQRAAFGDGSAVPDPGIAFLRRDLRCGRLRCALTLREGRPVAAASLVGVGSVAELAGVGTLPEERRRGAASAVSTALLAAHFAGGGLLAWLTAGDEAAAGVYARLGFRNTGAWQVDLQDG